ncbi:MAG: molybdopterin-dependent oxidoreductase, partial [Thermoanaerobaculia bacterium]
MNVTRRAVLGFGGGAAVGIALSPAPWKLLDDLGIWTQNWKWIPRPPHGPVTLRTTNCSLCTAGCAVQARCIGGHPVAMKAVAADTLGSGALCPLGQTGHHLRYHPARLTSAVRIGRKSGAKTEALSTDAVVAETARALRRSGTVAVLDMRPGRSVSWGWRRLMAEVPDGVVINGPGREGASLATLRGMLQGDAPAVGVDLEHARAILSFGAPLAEGWGSPHFTGKLLRRGKGELHFVQVDPTRTRTAEVADRWLAARPGTEAVLALGIGHVMLAEGLATADAVKASVDLSDYVTLVDRFTPQAVEAVTGVPAQSIVLAAREIAGNLPAVVIAGEDAGGGRFGTLTETAILGLNALLGTPGQEGGVIAHAELPAPFADEKLAAVRELDEVPAGSISLLLIDSSAGEGVVPWPVISKKLAKDARVIAMSPYLAGLALHADLVVPTAPFLEGTLEIATPFDSTRPMLALAVPIGTPREGIADPIEFVRTSLIAAGLPATGDWTKSEELIRARVAAIHASGDGEVVAAAAGTTTPMADLASADDLWTA